MTRLREEITKTLTRLTRSREFAAASAGAASLIHDDRTGRQLGIYRILRRLGAGGMGHVYLALDMRLGRHVALKFLAPELVTDQVSLIRLVQEARAASALNHPNILTIYDVGELDGEPFIASEFVEGITLRTAMQRDLVNVDSAIDITGQIASALNAAHEAGVIHRDLKPSNIMLRPDGYIKVIDFGLAKRLPQTAGESRSAHAEVTRPGTALGTVEYMSPEQARGFEVDYRTDIWSLGIVLYEMLAGRRPFEGPTENHVVVAILDHPVPRLSAGKAVPPAVQDVLGRALAKNPKDRFSSALDVWHALEDATGKPRTSSHIRIAATRHTLTSSAKRLLFISVLAIVFLAAGAFFWSKWREPRWFRIQPFRQLTFNGRTRLAVLSPDARYLAYTVGEPDGQQALYLKQIDAAADELKIPPRHINYRGLTFSPDNQSLYIVEKDESLVGRLYAVPLLGARPNTPIVVDIDGPVSFSPSGEQFVYIKYRDTGGSKGSVSTLVLSSRDGQTQRQLVSTSDVFIFRQPAWSPDGKRIAVFVYAEQPHGAAHAFLDLIRLDGSESRRLMADWQDIGQPRWSAGGKSLIVGVGTYSESHRQYQLHQLAIKTGEDRVLTNDLAGYTEPSLSADGAQLTAIKTDSKAAVWISRQKDFTHGDTVPAETERIPALAWADSAHLIVNSRRNGFPNLGLLDPQTQSFSPITNEHFVEQGVAVIPGSGGRSLVFGSNRSGQFHIWRFDTDTNKLRQLTSGPNNDQYPAVSPDGRWIVYTSWSQNIAHMRKVSVDGGTSTQIGSYNAEGAQISPDGSSIACYIEDIRTGKYAVAVVPFSGEGASRPLARAGTPFRWSQDGRSLVSAISDQRGVSNLWRFPLNGGKPVQLTRFEDQQVLAFAWSPTGDRIACLRATVGADVTLFKAVD